MSEKRPGPLFIVGAEKIERERGEREREGRRYLRVTRERKGPFVT